MFRSITPNRKSFSRMGTYFSSTVMRSNRFGSNQSSASRTSKRRSRDKNHNPVTDTIKEDTEDSTGSRQLDFGQVVDLVLTRPNSTNYKHETEMEIGNEDQILDQENYLDTKSIR